MKNSRWLAVIAALVIVAPSLAEARAGGGTNSGSRGSNTGQAPAPTQTAPAAKPIERSATPQQPAQKPATATPASATPQAGGFMARTLRPNEAGRRACTLFFNGVRRRLGLPENGAPVWDWLDSQSAIAAADYAQLRVYYEQLSGGRQVDFPSLHNLIERMKGCFV